MLWPWGYSRFAMENVLGVLAFILFCLCVVGVAAGITWVVVRLSPSKKPPPEASS
jgi:hypothetical protein